MSAKFLDGKNAVVTGGTRGIGRAIARGLLEAGASVAICSSRQQSIDEAIADLRASGPVFGMTADVSQIGHVRAFAAAVAQKLGSVNILVNNAGIGIFRGAAEISPEEWNRVIGLNLSGVYYCCHEFLPMMRKAGAGDVLNISSLAGKNAFAGGSAYNASKFGLNGFAEALMLDYRNEGIRVTTIMPGSVDTAFGGEHGSGSNWKIAPDDIAETVVSVLRIPRRTTISEIHIRPSMPPAKH